MSETPSSSPVSDTPSAACHAFAAQLGAYTEGRLAGAAARALERHAGVCDACAARLERVFDTRTTAADVSALVAAVPFETGEAEALRAATLGRVRAASARPRPSRPALMRPALMGVGTLLAASLAILLARRPAVERPLTGDTSAPSVTDSTWMQYAGAASAPMRTALLLAQREAAPELAAIDTAAREVARALDAAPDDEALREFRDALVSRKRELEARVARVTE